MKKSPFIFIMFVFTTNITFAQKHDYISIFGYGNGSTDPRFGGATIDFNVSPPRIYADPKKVDMGFYCGICSDSMGKLQFYTNGISIRSTTHNIMENGDMINPGEIWNEWYNDSYPGAAGAIAVPAPGLPNQYYLFHVATFYDNGGPVILPLAPLYYSLIDMNTNGGKGKVVSKNNVLTTESTLGHALVKHANGRDWWYLTGILNTPKHLLWLIDPTGIHGPFEQDYGPEFPSLEGRCNTIFSPDGALFIRNDCLNGMRIYDFDRCTGLLSNLRIIPLDQVYSGFATFSPSSRYLYFQTSDFLTSLDMLSDDPATTLDTLLYYDGFVSPNLPFNTGFWINQLEPDGKLWWATTSSTFKMHIAHHPDLPGLAADIEQHGISLPKFNNGTICRFPNYRLGPLVGSPCDTVPFNGTAPEGFQSFPYRPKYQEITGYKILSPIRGNKSQNKDANRTDFTDWNIQESMRQMMEHRKKLQQKEPDNH